MIKNFAKTDYNKIIYSREIDIEDLSDEERKKMIKNLEEYKRLNPSLRLSINKNRILYDTEVLIPLKRHPDRINLLLVFGNPAVHSIEEGMFFSYEKTRRSNRWREHRAWKALKECGVLELREIDKVDIHKPTPDNIEAINDYKRNCLLKAEYKSPFNVFMLPYFSFSTPASGKYNGVAGIKKLFGKELFRNIEELEFQRFRNIALGHKIRYVVSFQKGAFDEIFKRMENKEKPAFPHEKSLKNPSCELYIGYINSGSGRIHKILLYQAPPTRLLLGKRNKETLRFIMNRIISKDKYFTWSSDDLEFIPSTNKTSLL